MKGTQGQDCAGEVETEICIGENNTQRGDELCLPTIDLCIQLICVIRMPTLLIHPLVHHARIKDVFSDSFLCQKLSVECS